MSYEVVVPAFKVESTIAETLESLLGQSLAPERIIVADDASPDAAAQVAERYDGVDVLRFEHGGLAATQNKALEHVRAEFVAYVDADDVWHPEAGRMLVEALRDTGAVAASLGPDRFRDGTRPAFAEPPSGDSRELSYEELVRQNVLIKAGTMYRTEALRAVQGWREELSITSDHDVALRLMDAGGRVRLLPWRGVGLRVVSTGMSRHPAKTMKDQLELTLPRAGDRGSEAARRHARRVWLRALALAAEDRRDLRDVPALTELDVPAPAGQRPLELLCRSPLRHALGAGWRRWRSTRPGWAGRLRESADG
jgi:hypothetical protein